MTDDAGVTPDTTKDAAEATSAESKPADAPETGAESTDVEKLNAALKSERAARKAAEKRAKEFETRSRELEDKDKSESEKAIASAAEWKRRAEESEATLIRLEVATERKFQAEAVPLLSGTTREEIEASADRLAAFAASNVKSAPSGFDGGARSTPPETKTPEAAHSDFLLRALGRSS